MKYLKVLNVLLSLAPYLFATGLYWLYFQYSPLSQDEASAAIRNLFLFKVTGVLSAIAIGGSMLNFLLLFYFHRQGCKKKQSYIGLVIFYIIGVALLVYISSFDNTGAAMWFFG